MAVTGLILQAEQCPYVPKRIQLYCTAAQMCKLCGFYQREAAIHCKLFNLTLRVTKLPHLALEHATDAINADPTYGEVSLSRRGYIRRVAFSNNLAICHKN